ncbi:MAG: 30S ribosomal protein S21, small subunit ribosomal protein S21 [Candidatus Dadabacteria bacterium CSP1-2]|jgi:small subunit ribosomal protein S21|nr:MAG: 30S ribosomal protein S21, small subunit ribosomal protein S21 [Candidatus Dadabacteria bacterium CSP1-2]
MAEVVIGKNESIDNALRRFKRLVEKEGIIAELRKRDHYEKPSEKKKKRARAARLRLLKRVYRKE